MLPTQEELALPHVPPAPFAPTDSELLLPVGIKLYTTASKSLYGASSHIKSENLGCIYSAMDLLRFMDYKPAEWVQYRMTLFRKLRIGDQLPRAPVHFVFSTKAITEPGFTPGDLALPRCVFTSAAREFCKRWRSKRRSEEFYKELASVREYNVRMQTLLDEAVNSGEFVWFQRFG